MFDKNNTFSDAVALTATANSDYLDMLAAVMLGAGGKRMRCALGFNGVAPGGTAPTVTAALVGADTSDFGTGKITIGATTVPLTSGTVVKDIWEISVNQRVPKRYYRIEYTIGGTTPTMTVTAALVEDIQASPPLTGA